MCAKKVFKMFDISTKWYSQRIKQNTAVSKSELCERILHWQFNDVYLHKIPIRWFLLNMFYVVQTIRHFNPSIPLKAIEFNLHFNSTTKNVPHTYKLLWRVTQRRTPSYKMAWNLAAKKALYLGFLLHSQHEKIFKK